MLVSEDGVSIKAKNRIKKMVKLNILKKEQKLIKMHEPAGLWAKSQIHRQDARGDSRTDPMVSKGKAHTAWFVPISSGQTAALSSRLEGHG